MRDFNWYCDAAKERNGFTSDAQLSREIGIQAATVSQMRAKKSPPSPAVMKKLASLAGVPDDMATLDLSRWKIERDPNAAWMVESIERLFRHATAPIILLALIGGVMPADATQQSRNGSVLSSVYYA
jgi:transcriptional regulator with XRE-family HTH domain